MFKKVKLTGVIFLFLSLMPLCSFAGGSMTCTDNGNGTSCVNTGSADGGEYHSGVDSAIPPGSSGQGGGPSASDQAKIAAANKAAAAGKCSAASQIINGASSNQLKCATDQQSGYDTDKTNCLKSSTKGFQTSSGYTFIYSSGISQADCLKQMSGDLGVRVTNLCDKPFQNTKDEVTAACITAGMPDPFPKK